MAAWDAIAGRISTPSETLHAPHVLDLEVAQALRRLVRQGAVTETRASEALGDLADLRLRRYAHGPLVDRIWELRSNLTVFDAAYVALAEALDAPLVTADAALARAPGHTARVEVYR